MLTIYTDWSSIGNPWSGGRSAIITNHTTLVDTLSWWYRDVTNNQMELMWAIQALEYCIINNVTEVKIITDSQYVKNGIQSWITNRKRNGRRTAARKPVANQSLWMRLDQATQNILVTRSWTKGHANNKRNNLADQHAQQSARNKHTWVLEL